MYSGWVGLSTVRGSATSGYVQANRSHVRASDVRRKTQQNTATGSSIATAATDDKRSVGRTPTLQQRRSTTRILSKQEQERLQRRQVENELLELRERLEEGGILTPEQIDVRVQRERDMLLQRLQQSKSETEEQQETKKIPQQGEECQNLEEPLTISPLDEVALLPLTADGSTDTALLGIGRPNTFEQQAKADPKFSDVRQEDRQRHPLRQSAAATSYPMGRSKPLLHSSHNTKAFLKERENDKIRNAFGIPKDLQGSAYDRERKRKAQLMEARAAAERQKLVEQQQEEEIEKNLQKAARRRMKETGQTASSKSSSSSSSQSSSSVTSTTSTSTPSRERRRRKRNSSRNRSSSRNSMSSQSYSSSSSFSSSRSSSSRSKTSASSRSSFSSRSSSSDQSHSTSVSSKGHRHLSSNSSNAQSSDRRSPESSQNSSKPKLQPNKTLRRKRVSSSSIPSSIETSSRNSSECSSYPPRTRKRSKSRKSAHSDESSH